MTGMVVFRFPDGRKQWRSPDLRRYRVGDSFEHDGEWYRVCAIEDRGRDEHDDASEEPSGFIQTVTLISMVAPRHVGTPVAPG